MLALILTNAFATNIAVLNLDSHNKMQALRMEQDIRTAIEDQSFADINVLSKMETTSFIRVLNEEHTCSNLKCAVELGSKMGMDFVVYGTYKTKHQRLVLNVADINKGKRVFRKDIRDLKNNYKQNHKLGKDVSKAIMGERDVHYAQISQSNRERRSVTLRAFPKNADVWMNGERVCSQTPCRIFVEDGLQQVDFIHEDYKAQTWFFTNQSDTFTAKLKPQQAHVYINTAPGNFKIKLDGKVVGTTKTKKLSLSPGEHTIQVVGQCTQSKQQSFYVQAGDTEHIDLKTIPKKAKLRVHASRNGLSAHRPIYIDNEWVGYTDEHLNVDLCSKELRVGKRYTEELSLKPNRTNIINVEIKRNKTKHPLCTLFVLRIHKD